MSLLSGDAFSVVLAPGPGPENHDAQTMVVITAAMTPYSLLMLAFCILAQLALSIMFIVERVDAVLRVFSLVQDVVKRLTGFKEPPAPQARGGIFVSKNVARTKHGECGVYHNRNVCRDYLSKSCIELRLCNSCEEQQG